MTPETATARQVVVEALVRVSGHPAERCQDESTLLEAGLGIDSLFLLVLVETVQSRLGISVPDEVTARVRTVGDLHRAVHQLTTATHTHRGVHL